MLAERLLAKGERLLARGIRAMDQYIERHIPGGMVHREYSDFVGGRISLKKAYENIDAVEEKLARERGSLRTRFMTDVEQYALSRTPADF